MPDGGGSTPQHERTFAFARGCPMPQLPGYGSNFGGSMFENIEGAVVRTLDIREPTEMGKWDHAPQILAGAEFAGFVQAIEELFPGWTHHRGNAPEVVPRGAPGLVVAYSARVVVVVYGRNHELQVAFVPNPRAESAAAKKAVAKAADKFFFCVRDFYPGAMPDAEARHVA